MKRGLPDFKRGQKINWDPVWLFVAQRGFDAFSGVIFCGSLL